MNVRIKDLKYVYNEGSPFEKLALDNINLDMEEGSIVGIVGHTGSGKSTLIQHFNGLLKPTSGKIIVTELDLSSKSSIRLVRKKVGIVFQYPEYQLFEDTVFNDIAFGPKNIGLSEEKVEENVKLAMELVDLNYYRFKDKSPFELSGGEKRRVAIAGVFAMRPEILILDEPTAGLDPLGRDQIMGQIKKYRKENPKNTIIIISHNMEEIVKIADKIVVMNKGGVSIEGTPKEVFKEQEKIELAGLRLPEITNILNKLKNKYPDIDSNIFNIDEAVDIIDKLLKGKKV